MVNDTSNQSPDKRGALRAVLIWKTFFPRSDFLKIKFADLFSQNTQIIHV